MRFESAILAGMFCYGRAGVSWWLYTQVLSTSSKNSQPFASIRQYLCDAVAGKPFRNTRQTFISQEEQLKPRCVCMNVQLNGEGTTRIFHGCSFVSQSLASELCLSAYQHALYCTSRRPILSVSLSPWSHETSRGCRRVFAEAAMNHMRIGVL
ncbi:hypothetical protein EJ03DRAFT_59765 [Teratosphaeria nubilosa]|uniref:Uncharacterized protein n=1 Tax=Teratosphaeria nubilosa TaxID=161662 RepID=A0A6G1LCF6_9PEZI|nr:hypothetical protein EJ03DRAFT_59765 [Teratosphaeria nubilosa]